jgi:universal stress protein E
MGEEKRILVVIDPTSDEQPAFARAVWLAGKLDAVLELFICDYDQHLAGERFYDAESLQRARRALLDNHMKRLEALAATAEEQGVVASADARWDHPLDEGILRKIADCNPRYVVKDTHYHSVLKRSVFSNTDWMLIRECPIPLLLVKPRALAEPPVFVAAVDPVHDRDKPAELDHHILALTQKLCDATGGDLHVFHAFNAAPAFAVSADSMAFPVVTSYDETVSALRTRHCDAVNELVEPHGIAAAKVHVTEGATGDAMIALVEELGADVVVMGAVSRAALKRLFIGSTAEQVLDHLPCDVLIVKPRAVPAADEG